jgi:hypothetical protein
LVVAAELALALLAELRLPAARLLAELRLPAARLLAELRLLLSELPGRLLGLLADELLQMHRDLLHGGGEHLRQDDLMRDRQELAHQRLDDLLDRELLPGELLLTPVLLLLTPVLLGLAEVLLTSVLLGLAEVLLTSVLLGLAEVLLDAERKREAGRVSLLRGHALNGRTLGGDWCGHGASS